jgi:hypothetical protein
VSIVFKCDVGLFVVEEEDERLKRARVRDTVLQVNWRLEKAAATQTVPLFGAWSHNQNELYILKLLLRIKETYHCGCRSPNRDHHLPVHLRSLQI